MRRMDGLVFDEAIRYVCAFSSQPRPLAISAQATQLIAHQTARSRTCTR